MPAYQIALVVTIDSDSYQDALREAQYLAEGVAQDGEFIYAVWDYETDNDGQRVLYLPPVPA